ncbi:hypothetical protein IWW36_003319 [Coemansia brasiliensis]|uniref:Wbp11/ELF5/Saf1 N-terminal domain-containing protein n=1 Tax=Coemansia brasiliensis TaxID=2650707 RepID=A0A9W8M067_9FUNG|nr:hypothetical protein IWW36_003319 [Coemansia brasiliensis]
MAKGSMHSINPAEAYRRQMKKRENKRNKEVRKQLREEAALHKDTAKLEHKIAQLRGLTEHRKLTAAERERLKKLEDEFKEIRDKKREAGITPQPRKTEVVVGYDPLAESDDSALVHYESSEDEESQSDAESVTLGETVPIDRDIFGGGSDDGSNGYQELGLDALPPMPPGTPPLFASDLGLNEIWPPLPSGPSPQFIQENPSIAPDSGYSRSDHQPQPKSRGNKGPKARSNVSAGHTRMHPYTPHSHRGQGMPRPLATAPKPHSGTVLSAEPQVRDLKKELTTMVPANIARKNKQKERQQVLAAIPTPPQMVVNAAPQVDDSTSANKLDKLSLSTKLGTAISDMKDVQLSVSATVSNPQKPPKRPKTTLDEEYQRFMDDIGKLG